MQLNRKLRLLASRVNIILPARSLTTVVELGISKLLSFGKIFVSIQALLRHNEYRKANYKKKVTLPAKKPLNALYEKRLQSSMFEWTLFYNFLEFHCTILNSYAIYRCKKMEKILNCYLCAKKSYSTLS